MYICFQNALKSCKQQAKNLADMAKEIEAIERVTSPGDLPSRLEAAENATVDVEKKLAKTVSITADYDAGFNSDDILMNFTFYRTVYYRN